MTAATLSRLPLMAGGTLAGSLGRGGLWTLARALELGAWSYGQFMRAPLAISAAAGIAGLCLLAGGNALFFQPERHPAPLFFAPPRHAVPASVRPVVPAPRPRLQPTSLVEEGPTGSLGSQPDDAAIDAADVMALQQKLVALKLLDDTPDGIFGRRTAAAIRAFEARFGMRADGRLTPRIIAAVAAATVPAAEPAPRPLPAVQQSLPPAPAVVAATPLAAAGPAAVPTTERAPLAAAMPPAAVPATPAPAVAAAVVRPVPLAPLPAAPATTVAAAPVPPVAADDAAPAANPGSRPAASTFAANALPPAGEAAPDAGGDTLPAAAAATPDGASGGSTVAMTAAPGGAGDAGQTPAQRLAAQMGTLPPEASARTASLPPATTVPDESNGSTDPELITQIQRGLASLGFLGARIDGVPGEGTAKAIRNFEVFYDYRVTGLATHQLLDLLRRHGAVI